MPDSREHTWLILTEGGLVRFDTGDSQTRFTPRQARNIAAQLTAAADQAERKAQTDA